MTIKAFDNLTLGQKMKLVPQIQAWCAAVMAEGEGALKEGRPVDGWKLVKGKRSNRAWNTEAVAADTLRLLGYGEDIIYVKKINSPAVIEKTVKPEDFEQVKEFYSQAEGQLQVASEDDPRPAIELKPATDFFNDLDDLTGGLA